MATLEQVAASVLSSLAVDADKPIGIELVADWINRRYEQLLSRVRFRHRRRLGVLTMPAAIVDGTVDATQGSATIVADGDAQTAITAAGGGAAIVGRYIRVANVWHEITAYVAPNITIASVYSEADAADHGFLIVKRYHDLASDARWMGRFVHMRRRIEVENRPLESFDRELSDRVLTSGGPWMYAEATINPTTGIKRVELYPYSRDPETIHYVYWAAPAILALEDDLPRELDAYVLREGALIDAFRYRASQEANANRVEAAAFWRNESRAQETRWEALVREAARTDRGADDVSFVYHLSGLPVSYGDGDIMTARDEVWIRGSRP